MAIKTSTINIGITLDKDFITQYNTLQAEYGSDIAQLNGFGDDQLSYTDFIDNFIDNDTVADVSVDGNSNVRRKDIVTLITEMPKPHRKLLAYNKSILNSRRSMGLEQQIHGLNMSGLVNCISTMQIQVQ